MKRWFCTDCEDTFRAETEGRCPMCYGARVIGPVAEDKEPELPVARPMGQS